MTETALRQKVAAAANAYLGKNEADGSFREIIDRYNAIRPLPVNYRMSYNDPWCAAFVSVVGADCGLSDIVFPECACERMISLYRRAGRWQEDDNYNAQLADLVMYDWEDSGEGDDLGEADHVGIIVAVTSYAYTVVEGNSSDRVQPRVLQRNSRFIRGFCCPDYASKCGSAVSPVTPTTPAPTPAPTTPVKPAQLFSAQLPMLRQGCGGAAVVSLQGALIAHGCDCGPDGPDGDFGPATAAALRRFQSEHGLTADAIFGPATCKEMFMGGA